MTRIFPLLLLLSTGLAACASEPAPPPAPPITPSPTSDQVLAEQYRATNTSGAMSGAEADVIEQAYLRQLDVKPMAATPTQEMPQSTGSQN